MERNQRIYYGLLILLCLVLGIVISLQFKSNRQTLLMPLMGESLSELEAHVQSLEEENLKLRQDIETQQEQARDLIAAQEDATARENLLQRDLKVARTFAGLTEAEGPGAIVTAESASEEEGLQAAEILILLNEFRAAGAHGLAINDQRIVAMSEVRSVGSGNREIMVNGQRISQNGRYELSIIGEKRSLQNAWSMLASFRHSLEKRSIELTIQFPETVRLPALSESSPAYRTGYLNAIQAGE